MSWVTIAEPKKRVNLLELQQGTTTLLGAGELPVDQYRAVQLVINTDSSSITTAGSEWAVHWNGPAIQAIHAFVEDPVAVPQQGAEIVIDFDVGRSFHYDDLGDGYFNFLPWIRAVNKAGTGSIAGTITSDPDTFTYIPPGPVKAARVSAWGHSQGIWQIFSTGASDAAGHYRLAYLRPGSYIVQVDPPSVGPHRDLTSDLDSNVAVVLSAEGQHSVALTPYRGEVQIVGPSSMLLGRTNTLEAIVLNSIKQRDDTAPVSWRNLDSTILDLSPTGRFASVTSKKVGTGRVMATSGSLMDTLSIFVAPDSTSP
jgi:hypothetical protein